MPLLPHNSDILLQIGSYRKEPESSVLTHLKSIDSCRTALYQGIQQYESKHQQDIIRYAKSKKPSIILSETDINDPQYFRKLFILQMITLNQNSEKFLNKNITLQENHPKKSAISIKELFGRHGLKLYKKALEEEVYSENYMDALFENSVKHYSGRTLSRPMTMFIAGPSASGKSFIEKEAFLKALEVVPTDPDNLSGNDVFVIDGGIARETSQIRKLAIQVALNKGYSGILDLHAASKIVEKTRDRLYRIALSLYQSHDASLKMSLVIPETFSTFGFYRQAENLLAALINLSNVVTVFSRVIGVDKNSFRETVSWMGEKRAFSTKPVIPDGNHQPLDLNKTSLPESKAYGSAGFKFGVLGSERAEKWYIRNSKDKIVIKIINDLRIYKPLEGSNQWILAKKGEPKTILRSQRLFEVWNALSDSQKQETPFDQYSNPTLKPQIEHIAAHKEKKQPRKKFINTKNEGPGQNFGENANQIYQSIEQKMGNAGEWSLFKQQSESPVWKTVGANQFIKETNYGFHERVVKLTDKSSMPRPVPKTRTQVVSGNQPTYNSVRIKDDEWLVAEKTFKIQKHNKPPQEVVGRLTYSGKGKSQDITDLDMKHVLNDTMNIELAVQQASMLLRPPFSPQHNKLIINGDDLKQVARLHAAILWLKDCHTSLKDLQIYVECDSKRPELSSTDKRAIQSNIKTFINQQLGYLDNDSSNMAHLQKESLKALIVESNKQFKNKYMNQKDGRLNIFTDKSITPKEKK